MTIAVLYDSLRTGMSIMRGVAGPANAHIFGLQIYGNRLMRSLIDNYPDVVIIGTHEVSVTETEILKKIKQFVKAPIVFMASEQWRTNDKQRSLEHGAESCFSLPDEMGKLQDKITKCFEQRTP